jgi:uncharacterized membrane protein
MLKFISRNILTGLVTILPVALTIYLLYWMAVSAETVLGSIIQSIFPEVLYWPGIGLIAALAAAFVMGEQILYRMPLIKSVYKAIRDFFQYFSPTAKKEFEQVVSVSIGNTGMKVIGFVTQEVPDCLPDGFREEDSILVYLPLSYMIGGYAVLVPRGAVRPLDMNMEEAMRFTLTAGVTGTSVPPPGGKKE